MKSIIFDFLITAACGIGSVYALWVFYLAVMNLKRAADADRLSPMARRFGTPVLFAGYVLDFLVNLIPFTVLMLDLPRETTVTARLKRYANGSDSWRRRFALWFADDLLNDFDPSGKHV